MYIASIICAFVVRLVSYCIVCVVQFVSVLLYVCCTSMEERSYVVSKGFSFN